MRSVLLLSQNYYNKLSIFSTINKYRGNYPVFSVRRHESDISQNSLALYEEIPVNIAKLGFRSMNVSV